MTLPASPPITLAQVRAEFGAPAGTPLHAFVRGGAWVPNNASNGGVPTAPPITLHQLCGAADYVPVSATASPTSISGITSGPNLTGTVTSNSTTATGHNGDGSYTYSWTGPAGLTINSPNSRTTTVTRVMSAGTYTGTITCKVSDGTSNDTVSVGVTLTYTRD